MSKSARINFGIPDSEYIVRVDDTGAATSCYNQDTDTEYVGGGGDSDFSTAELTLISEVDIDGSFSFITVYEENELGEGAPACISYSIYPILEGTHKYKIPLYKGVSVHDVNLETSNIQSYSGNITSQNNMAIITGDCSIVIVDAS